MKRRSRAVGGFIAYTPKLPNFPIGAAQSLYSTRRTTSRFLLFAEQIIAQSSTRINTG